MSFLLHSCKTQYPFSHLFCFPSIFCGHTCMYLLVTHISSGNKFHTRCLGVRISDLLCYLTGFIFISCLICSFGDRFPCLYFILFVSLCCSSKISLPEASRPSSYMNKHASHAEL